MLDDEIEIGEVRRHVVDIGDIERVAIQRPDRRALVDVDVADAEFAADLEVAAGRGVVELVAARLAVPLRGVELDALQPEPLRVGP